MTWWLEKFRPEDAEALPLPLAERPTPSWSERFRAGVQAGRIEDDSWGRSQAVEDDYIREVETELSVFRGPDFERTGRRTGEVYGPDTAEYGKPKPRAVAPVDPTLFAAQRRRETMALIARAKKADPAKWGHLPDQPEDWTAEVNARRQAEYDEQVAVLEAASGFGWGAEFAGRGWAGMTDPVSLITLPLGGPAAKGAWGLTKFVAAEAGIAAGSELLIADRRQQVAADLDVPEPNLLMDVGTAALFGGAIAGIPGLIVKGAQRAARFRQERSIGGGAGREAGTGPGAHEGAVAGNADALAKGQTPPGAPGKTLPPLTPDAPPNWEAIRGGIFRGESGGDYEALYGYSNRPGGPFENVKLTEMTVDEAIAFSDPNGPYGQWVYGQIGRVATPMGAYQIVGKTLRAAKAGLGLRGDELMNEAMQERLGQYIYRTQGTGAWEGYAGPDAGFRPGDGAAYQGEGRTSRGYTGSDQIAAGDMRIGVEYAVVDASLLKRATGRFQPRDRSRINSDVQIADMAARLDPEQLMPSPNAATGTPIIGPDMMVESGNGRVAAIGRAYELHPDRAAAYRARIEAAGFEIPAGVERPILVARRTTALDDAGRERFAIEAQDAGTARMTPTEIARTSAKAMTADRLARFRPEAALGEPENRDFLQSVLSALPASERNALFDPSGALNAEGRRRLSGAFFARAWDDGGPLGREIVGRFAELEDPGELKSLIDALEEAAPAWATLRAEIEAGAIRPEFDITGHVLDALSVIVMARRDAARLGGTIADAVEAILAQGDMFAAANPLSVALLRKFWRDGRAAPAADIARFLQRYADEARTVGRDGDMLGASPAEALRAIDGKTFADLPDEIPPVARAAEPPIEDLALPEKAYAEGAASPEAEAADDAAIQALRDPETQPFGPVFTEESGNPEAAMRRLFAEQTGEVPAAITREDLGEIAFVYGNDKYGLRHIEAKHPEILPRLADLLREGDLVGRRADRAYIQLPGSPPPSAVIRLDWDGREKTWLVTAFDDDQGQITRQLRRSNEPAETASSRIPDATGQGKDRPDRGSDQAPDAIQAELSAARVELGDLTFKDENGAQIRAADLLDDIEADQSLIDVIDACMIGGRRA